MQNITRTRKTTVPTFFGDTLLKGKRIEVDLRDKIKPKVFYQHENGQLWLGDSIQWLKSLPAESVDMIFADPPYNIKKADWDNFESQEAYIKFSMEWIESTAKILKPTGTLFICGFSEILADLKHPASRLFQSCRWLIWHYKNKANLGSDWGRSHESILQFRKSKNFTFNIDTIRIPYNEHTLKYPSHPQAETSQYGNGKKTAQHWTPNKNGAKPKDVLDIPQDLLEIPTTCNGMHEKTPHPTQKPEELLRKLILASSNVGDTVLDPFCGSGTTPVCSEQLQRQWLACDLSPEYLEWAANRIDLVEDWSIDTWIKYDFENLKRRNSIR
ncbi:MAG: site-specific DNA-methyltransferase [Planctomycetaceae bacterium]|jgi:site-specific DNA-methyltransferase (adenine-specific)|nr:site-specific DNA-methyltransferase [Planctomycetaceae bacterium]